METLSHTKIPFARARPINTNRRLCYNADMEYRTEITTVCSQTVFEDNPLLSLFDKIEEQQSDPGRYLCCARCQSAITTANNKIEVNSRHTFQLTNPSGMSFNVACFKDAWGCGIYGEATDVHTWFPGFDWQYAYCLSCEEHLGWYYENSREQHFFGLVTEKLVTTEDER
ncbi:MAG: cereblon family protein [Pseudomonadales bacterium]